MYKVEGYEFETEEQARAAAKEFEQIKYLKSQTDDGNPEVVLTLYNKLVDRGTFRTRVGLEYLLSLRGILEAVPYIKAEDIKPLPDYFSGKGHKEEQKKTEKKPAAPVKKPVEDDPEYEKRQREREQAALLRQEVRAREHYKKMFHISTFFAVVFALAMIGMVVITIISKDNVTIVNYENSLINKYETWENELNEREAELEQREQQLNE